MAQTQRYGRQVSRLRIHRLTDCYNPWRRGAPRVNLIVEHNLAKLIAHPFKLFRYTHQVGGWSARHRSVKMEKRG